MRIEPSKAWGVSPRRANIPVISDSTIVRSLQNGLRTPLESGCDIPATIVFTPRDRLGGLSATPPSGRHEAACGNLTSGFFRGWNRREWRRADGDAGRPVYGELRLVRSVQPKAGRHRTRSGRRPRLRPASASAQRGTAGGRLARSAHGRCHVSPCWPSRFTGQDWRPQGESRRPFPA